MRRRADGQRQEQDPPPPIMVRQPAQNRVGHKHCHRKGGQQHRHHACRQAKHLDHGVGENRNQGADTDEIYTHYEQENRHPGPLMIVNHTIPQTRNPGNIRS